MAILEFDCIYPDCLIKTDFGKACEHSCPHEKRKRFAMTKKKKDGKYICRCECGGPVRGVEDFGRLFTWCEKCTPVEVIDLKKLTERNG